MSLRAGASEAIITPPVGVDLSGYADRPGPAEAIHDDLHCRALLLDDGRARLALLALDLLGVDFPLDRAIRDAVAEAGGLPTQHVLVNCSHTHAGPATSRLVGMGSADEAYLATLPARAAEAVARALAQLAPVRLSYAEGPAKAGINRRQRRPDGIYLGPNPEGLCDDRVRVLRVEAEGAADPLAVVFQHACHGTTLGGANRQITAEWMGVACRSLAARLGATPLFLQGCCGEINPEAREHSFSELTRIGEEMAAAVLRALDSAQPLPGVPLAARLETIELPLQDPPTPDVAQAHVARAEQQLAAAQREGAHPYWVQALQGLLHHARRIAALSESGAADLRLPFAVQAMRIGDLGLVALSGEVFFELAQAVVRSSPFPHTFVLGCSNGCTGYVPTAEAFDEGGYEVDLSFRYYGTLPLAPHAGDQMVAAASAMLRGLWEETGR